MNKISSFILSSFLLSLSVYAQQSGPNKPTPEQLSNIRLSNDYRKITPYFSYNEIKFNPLLVDDVLHTDIVNKPFLLGSIYFDDRIMSQKYYLRYNGFTDEIEIDNDEKLKSVQKNTRISCFIGNVKYIFSKINNKNSSEMSYLKEIYTNKNMVLYEREIVIFKKAISKIKTFNNKDTPARFVKFLSYYRRNDKNEIPTIIPSNKKKFINMYKKEYHHQIRKFIKTNQINLNNREDLLKIFSYSESLL